MSKISKLATWIFLLSLSISGWSQCTAAFSDGFESGGFTPTWSPVGTYTRNVNTNGAMVGSYAFHQQGAGAHFSGINTSFAPATPNYISVWAKTTDLAANSGYFVIGDANTVSNSGIIFFYFRAATGAGYLYAGSSQTATFPTTANTWYHLEFRNINWLAKSFDFYVNNTLIAPGFPFLNAGSTDVSRIYLYNFSGTATASYDQITVGGESIDLNATGSDLLCANDNDGTANVAVVGGTGPFTYMWSNGDNTASVANLTAGSYQVVVTDSLGCADSATAMVTAPPAITTSHTTVDNPCAGDTKGSIDLAVSGGVAGFSYQWSNGGTTQDQNNLPAGTYTVTITDNNGCTANQTAQITDPSAITHSGTTTGDNGSNTGTVDLTVTGGTPGYTYAWSGPGTFSATTEDLTGLAAGTYTVMITDANGCEATETFVVDAIVGLQDGWNQPIVQVAPNPTQGQLNVQIRQNSLQTLELNVFDVQGRIVRHQVLDAALQQTQTLDLSSLTNGIYTLQVTSATAQTLVRVVKQ